MAEGTGQRLTVLLVEDDDDMRALLRMRLELDGRFIVVAEAWNGAHGVGQAKVHDPDAIVLDMIMPVLDGAKALPLIRKVAPRAAIVTFSALTAEHPRVAALRGNDAHVCKTANASLPDALQAAWESRQRVVQPSSSTSSI